MTCTLDRTALRAACRIRDCYVAIAKAPPVPPVPTFAWQECLRHERRLELARLRGWSTRQLRERYLTALGTLQWQCENLVAEARQSEPAPIPTLRLIYEELCALSTEFDHMAIDLQSAEILVRTGRIVLEGIDLGPFEIFLEWDGLDRPNPYRVLAVDPHPAVSSEDSTHPHVQGQRLCEGDAQPAIRAALAEGRLGISFWS